MKGDPMKDICDELLAEYTELALLVESMPSYRWSEKTPFNGWTPWDEIAHLYLFDEKAMLAATDPEAFAADTAELMQQWASGKDVDEVTRSRFGHLDGPALVSSWRRQFTRLVELLSGFDAKARLVWYGPPMSARSFATARLMETWAHGQDVYDMLGIKRPVTDRIKNIAHLGVTTYGWSFMIRNLSVPEPAPYVELLAPSGQKWVWNAPRGEEHYVMGDAEEFCLVVTQRRNVADTGLKYAGNAALWLPLAQCFAGLPEEAPAPGTRLVRY